MSAGIFGHHGSWVGEQLTMHRRPLPHHIKPFTPMSVVPRG